jgi:hypothetical protein
MIQYLLRGGECVKIDMARINQIIQEVTSTEKVASEEDVSVDELILELEKVASETTEKKAIEGEGVTLRSDSMAKQRLKEILMDGIKSDDPSPVCQKLKDSLLADDKDQAREILEKVAFHFEEQMRTLEKR